MSTALKPCPVCRSAPERFRVYTISNEGPEVIACPRGCKPRPLAFHVHIRAVDVVGWADLGDAWNSMEVTHDENGLMRVTFEKYAPHLRAEAVRKYMEAEQQRLNVPGYQTGGVYQLDEDDWRRLRGIWQDESADAQFEGMTEAEFFGHEVGDRL